MEKPIDTHSVYRAIKAFTINTLVNNYAVERVAFGFEKPGDQAPVDLYLDHLHLGIDEGLNESEVIPGIYIDGSQRINDENSLDDYIRDLFVFQMEKIFLDAPKDAQLERESEELPLIPRFRDYLFGLLPLFSEVLNVDVDYDAFDLIPTEDGRYYEKWHRFVTAVLLKPLKTGGQINRYVKDFTDAPYYIERLITRNGKNFYLRSADVENYEYAFALFSLMRFMNAENTKLFELKMREWEERRIICPQ